MSAMSGRSMSSRTLAAVALAASMAASGCGGPVASEQLEVFAASSLAEAFRALVGEFEATHPGIPVSLTLAGSQVLRLQIEQGAPADVFASANPEHIAALVEAGLVRDDVEFATNELVVIVPEANPSGLRAFADLPRAERLVIGVATVPVGVYTRRMLERARGVYGEEFVAAVEASVVSGESNVRLVRAKVELGEADAAIVYRTDTVGASGLRTIAVPDAVNVRGSYRIGVVARSAHPAAGQWVRFVRSEGGRAVLERFGFGVPR